MAEIPRDAKPSPLGKLPVAALAEPFAEADARMWAAAHAMAEGVEPETGGSRGRDLSRSSSKSTNSFRSPKSPMC